MPITFSVAAIGFHEHFVRDSGISTQLLLSVVVCLSGRRFGQQHLIAQTLQRSLLPDRLPAVADVEVARYRGLEQAAALDTVVLDKTGTLTRGEPQVVAIVAADGFSEDEVLRLVAAAERESEHPLAEAIVNAARARPIPVVVPEALAYRRSAKAGIAGSVPARWRAG